MTALKGRFQPKNPKKYKGNPCNIIYRSSWELQFMTWADKQENIIQWCSEEVVIPYRNPVDNKVHRYFPDFYIKVKTKDNKIEEHLIEVKPYKQTQMPPEQKRKTKRYMNELATYAINEAKWKSASEFCKDRKWKFTLLTERELNR